MKKLQELELEIRVEIWSQKLRILSLFLCFSDNIKNFLIFTSMHMPTKLMPGIKCNNNDAYTIEHI